MNTRSFHFLTFARLISLIGDEVFMLGFPLYIFQKTGSVTQFGLSFFIEMSIYMIFSLIGGVIADRWNLRKTVIWIDTLSISIFLVIGYEIVHNFSIGLCYILLSLVSIFSALYNVSFDKLPVQFLEKGELSKMLSMFQSVREFSKIVGSPIGGLIFFYFGILGIFLVNILSFLFPIFVLLLFKNSEFRIQKMASIGLKDFVRQCISGFYILWSNPMLRLITTLAIFLNIPLAIYSAYWAVIYKLDFAILDKTLGFIQGFCAVAYVLATLFVGQRIAKNSIQSVKFLIWAQILAVVGSLIMFSAHELYFVIAGALLLNVANAFHAMPSTYLRTQNTNVSDYGKVLAAARVISRILFPCTIGIAAFFIHMFSVRAMLAVGGVMCILCSIPVILKILQIEVPNKQVHHVP